MTDAVQQTLAYHERTKHHPTATPRGRATWTGRPSPTRSAPSPAPRRRAAAARRRPGHPLRRPLRPRRRRRPGRSDGTRVAVLFELALGLSAWKQYRGSRWALRCNPSSGNLHPTEGYALLPALPGLEAGVYHYVSRDHLLERRCTLAGAAADRLAGRCPTARSSSACPRSTGARPGSTASGPSATASTTPGTPSPPSATRPRPWAGRRSCSTTCSDDDLAGAPRPGPGRRLRRGGRRPTANTPTPALLVDTRGLRSAEWPDVSAELVRGGTWAGQANPLSPAHVDWPVIDEVAGATWKPRTARRAAGRLPPLPAAPAGQPRCRGHA